MAIDFFEYSSLVEYFNVNKLWVDFLVGGLCFAIVFIFQSVGLFTIAAHEGYKHKWMAFIPFLNTYYMGVCAQKNKFYNFDARKIALVVMIAEIIMFAGYVFYYSCCNIVFTHDWLKSTPTDDQFLGMTVNTQEYIGPERYAWMGWVTLHLATYVLSPLELVFIILQTALLICFFQTYAANRYVLFTIASLIFPIQGILIFVVRNNAGMNYREYIRRQQERQYRIYQQYRQQQNFDGDPYNQNPYSRGNGAPPPPENDDPFDGEGKQPENDDPFDEFKN